MTAFGAKRTSTSHNIGYPKISRADVGTSCAEGGVDGETDPVHHAAALAIWLGRLPLADCLYPCWNFWQLSA
jgi:hypothetical protein